MSQQKEYSLRIEVFGQRYNLCRATVYNMIKRKELRAVKIGASTRLLMSDIEAWERSLMEVGEKANA